MYFPAPSRASASSIRPRFERSLSRNPSIFDVPEETQGQSSGQGPSPTPLAPGVRPPSSPSTESPPASTYEASVASNERIPRPNGSNGSLSNESTLYLGQPPGRQSNNTFSNDSGISLSNGRKSSASTERSGRARHRFSLSAVADAFRDAASPLTHRISKASVSRERPKEDVRSRGRTMERSLPHPPPSEDEGPFSSPTGHTSRGLNEPTLYSLPGDHRTSPRTREPFAAMWSGAGEVKDKRNLGHGWKEFRAGTYTYPISFSVPATAPPSMHCDFGNVVWKLHAHVHRPGAFKSKYTATKDVQVIACPTEEDTEDTENIIVERHWDQQLQYLISVSGRSFHIGGSVPVSFAFMPLAKVKLHRLSMFIEGVCSFHEP